MNEYRTCAKKSAKQTQLCSSDVPYRSREQRAADERQRLTGIRNIHGATEAIGYACSNLMEMKDLLPPAADERIDYLTPDHVVELEKQVLLLVDREEKRLNSLLAAGE